MAGLAAGAKAMAGSLGLATTAFSVFAAVAAAAIIGVAAYKAHMDSIHQSAVEGASAFSSAQSSLEEYTNKVKELRTALAEGTLTDSEAYAAKKELYEIQNSLVDTYGKQAAGIDLVNGSLEEQIQSLEKLSLLESQRLLNENKAGIDVAIREMTKTLGGKNGVSLGQYYDIGTDATNRMNDILSKYDNIIQNGAGDGGLVTVRFVGDATDAKQTLNDLMTDLRAADKEFGEDTHIFKNLFDYASAAYSDADQIIKKYQELYEQGMKAKLIEESVGDNPITYGDGDNLKTAAEWISAYTDAVKKYNDTLSSGDAGKISAARSEFEALNGTITGLLSDTNGLGQYAFMFNEISNALNQSAASAQIFKESIDNIPQETEKLKAAKLTDTQFASAFLDGLGSDATSRAIESILKQYANAFGLEFGNLTISQVESVARILTNMDILQKDTSAQKQPETKPASEQLSTLWNSEGFADSKTKLKELAQTAEGITADKIKDLAKDSKELTKILDESGISAKFLAHVFSEEIAGNHGFDLVTQDMLELDAALNSAAGLFDEVTAARERYNAASSAGEYDDSFKSFAQAFSTLQSQMEDGKQGKQFWAAAEYIFGSDKLDEWGYDIQKVSSAIAGAKDILSDADSGGTGFLDKLNSLAEGGKVNGADGSVLAEIQKLADGSYKFNIDLSQIDALADKMGVSKEAIMACMEALKLFGDVSFFDVDRSIKKFQDMGIASAAFNKTAINVEALRDTLHDLGYSGKDIFDIVSRLQGLNDVTLVDIYGDINNVVSGLKELGIATQSSDGITIDAEQFALLAQSLNLSAEQATNLFNRLKAVEGVQFAKDGQVVDDIQFEDVEKEVEVTVNVNDEAVDEFSKKDLDRDAIVTYGVNADAVDSFKSQDHSVNSTLTYTIVVNGSVPEHFANGTKGAPGGPALVGERGEELVQSGDTAYTVGSNGPEIVNLRPGDEVYTAEQTKKIKHGSYMTGSIPAYAAGTASDKDILAGAAKQKWTCVCGGFGYVGGNCLTCGRTRSKSIADASLAKKEAQTLSYNNGVNGKNDAFNAGGTVKPTTTKPSSGGGGGGGGSRSSGGSSDEEKEEEPKKIDWIEIQINRLERSIEKLKNAATSAFKTLSSRLRSSKDEIAQITEEIEIQRKAADRYLKEANSVRLSADLKQKVRDGTIDIREYDSETEKLINEYKEWYEKSLDAAEAIDTLHDSLASLYQDNFNNIKTDYENQLSFLDRQISSYQNSLDVMELQGYTASESLYQKLKQATEQNISVMNNEVHSLEKSLAEALASGEISEYSEAWYEMKNAIYDVREQIDEANKSIIEYNNSIRDIQWERFDFLRDSVSRINSEMEFLTQLLGYSDLFDDNGKITEAGEATAALMASQYNVYMNQADAYAEAVKSINKELANDPYNKTLIDRRNDLLEKQRESILAADEEKIAIRDLISKGIENELSAMKKLIDEYNNTIDSAKSLYDYQKKIKTSSADVARIQKLISAYQSGDDSEEARARIQKLTVDLQEAQDKLEEEQYSQYISDQKKLLDDLYGEYEEILNSRIDDIDALLSETIKSVNENASSIRDTIYEASKGVGYSLTTSMSDVLSTSSLGGIVTTYGEDFSDKMTTINSTLRGIEYGVIAMAEHSNSVAEGSIKAYRHGGLADFTGLARLDGSPSDPEVVLDAQDSKNLIALRNILRGATDIQSLINGASKSVVSSYSSDISDVQRIMSAAGYSFDRGEIHDINITIPIDRVNDYNDFVRQLRDDGQFERFIQDVTLGQIAKKNPLAKKRYTW